MANSIRAKIKKAMHNGTITQEDYARAMKKLDGHDAYIREKTIDECIEVVRGVKRLVNYNASGDRTIYIELEVVEKYINALKEVE